MAGRGSVHSLSSLQKTALLLGLPAAATVCYILYRRYRESREAQVTLVADEGLEVALRVPRTALKALIGRRGATINRLRQETGAQISVEEEEEEEEEEEAEGRSLVQISGSPGQVCRARAAVLRIVADSAPVAEQLRVPQRAVGRIIGRGGETVRGICRSSGARVECGHEGDAGLAPLRLIRLLGTRKEVEAAKKLIMEKLAEDKAFRRELAAAAAARCPRKQPLGSRREPPPGPPPGAPGSPGGWQECWDTDWAPAAGGEGAEPAAEGEEPPAGKFEVPSPDFSFPVDEHLDVYVSAAESPGRFWVQLLGARSLQLDRLTAEMGHFYRSSAPVAAGRPRRCRSLSVCRAALAGRRCGRRSAATAPPGPACASSAAAGTDRAWTWELSWCVWATPFPGPPRSPRTISAVPPPRAHRSPGTAPGRRRASPPPPCPGMPSRSPEAARCYREPLPVTPSRGPERSRCQPCLQPPRRSTPGGRTGKARGSPLVPLVGTRHTGTENRRCPFRYREVPVTLPVPSPCFAVPLH
nr:tudor and KH domain-containing protein isoform X2 [Taeniopygia guttata]